MKYVETRIAFAEVPDEITLAINISNCPCHCEGCHSAYLAADIGTPLDEESLAQLLCRHSGVSCVAFMGGDADAARVSELAAMVKRAGLKTCWYSGRQELSPLIDVKHFDYIKLGPYIPSKGGLDCKTTNQRLYRIHANGQQKEDITPLFWKN